MHPSELLLFLTIDLPALLHWAPWACLYEDDPQVGAMPSSLAMCLQAELSSSPSPLGTPTGDGWGRIEAAARQLFSRQPERRQQASQALRMLLQVAPPASGSLDETEPHMGENVRLWGWKSLPTTLMLMFQLFHPLSPHSLPALDLPSEPPSLPPLNLQSTLSRFALMVGREMTSSLAQ